MDGSFQSNLVQFGFFHRGKRGTTCAGGGKGREIVSDWDDFSMIKTTSSSTTTLNSFWVRKFCVVWVNLNQRLEARYPTTNGGVKNGGSVGTHVRRVCTFCMTSRCLLTKFLHRISVRSLFRVRCWLGTFPRNGDYDQISRDVKLHLKKNQYFIELHKLSLKP